MLSYSGDMPDSVVIGADVSSRSVAFFEIHTNGLMVPIKYKVPTKIIDRAEILQAIGDFVMSRQYQTMDSTLYVEAAVVAGARNIQSTIKVAMAIGVVVERARARHIEMVAIDSWKQYVAGKGGVSKDVVCDALKLFEHGRISEMCHGDQDLVDAASIALYGRGQLRQDRVTVKT